MSLFKHIPVVTTLLDTLGKRIDDLFTSDKERGDIATQQQKIALKQLVTQLKAQHTQLQINLQQTKHPSLFVAGARPAIIWIGGFRTWEKINGKARDNLNPQHGEYELMAKVMLEKYQTELDTPPNAFISNPSISQFKAAQKDGTFVPQYYQFQPNDRAKGN